MNIGCLLYADDLLIISHSSDDLQTSLKKLNTYCTKWALDINTKKSEIMVFKKDPNPNQEFYYNGEMLKIVKIQMNLE